MLAGSVPEFVRLMKSHYDLVVMKIPAGAQPPLDFLAYCWVVYSYGYGYKIIKYLLDRVTGFIGQFPVPALTI